MLQAIFCQAGGREGGSARYNNPASKLGMKGVEVATARVSRQTPDKTYPYRTII